MKFFFAAIALTDAPAGAEKENCRNRHHRLLSMDMLDPFGARIRSSG